jgi:caffeoyl-CoA O-methyltransferase
VKLDESWLPGEADLDYIEATSPPIHPVLEAIEEAAEPAGVPILDRASGRILAALAGDRRRIVEIGTAYGYSTLWAALGQPGDGTIVTIDPDRDRTDLARGWWRKAGVPDERITVVTAKALEAFSAGDPALDGPFDLAFIDALKHEYVAYLATLMPRLAPGALVVADNVLRGGWVTAAARGAPNPDDSDPTATAGIVAFNAAVLGDPRFSASILPVGDGLLLACLRP